MNPEVVLYLEAIGIVNDGTVYNVGTTREATGTQIYSIHNKLWDDLTTAGVRTKIRFMHLLMWGEANKNKLNFLDPQDLDASFRLTFNGGWTFDEQGSQPDGINGYADTHYNPNVQLSGTDSRNEHLGLYSLTNTGSTAGDFPCDLGAWGSSSAKTKISLGRGASKLDVSWRKSISIEIQNSIQVGYYLGTIRSHGDTTQRSKFFINGLVAGNVNTIGDRPNLNLYFGAENFGSSSPLSTSYTKKKYLLIHGGEGLTDIEANDLSTAIADYYYLLENAEEAPISPEEVSFDSILVEGEIQQNERFDESVSLSSITTEGESQRPKFKGLAFENIQEKHSFQGITMEQADTFDAFKGVAFEVLESGGFAQIIMLQK